MTAHQEKSPDPLDITLLCCTYNRSADLREMLESVLGQAAPGLRYEILVVDNNSNDGTREVVEGLIGDGHSTIRYLFEPRQGKSFALNTGLPAVRGAFFAIADDDLIFPADFLAKVMAAIIEHPAASCIGGKVLPHWLAPPPSWLTQRHWAALGLSDPGPLPIRTDTRNPVCLLAGVYRTADVLAVGGYDPALGVSGTRTGGTEDADLLRRLYAAGKFGVYTPDVMVQHKVEPHRTSRAYHRRWHTEHGRSHALMRVPSIEGSAFRVLGIPGHLLRSGVADAVEWVGMALRRDTQKAFEAELRLHFVKGYVRTRLRDTLQGKRGTLRPSMEAGAAVTWTLEPPSPTILERNRGHNTTS